MREYVSYNPLKITLVHKGMELRELEVENGGPLNKRTVSKLRHHDVVRIDTIAKVCRHLNVPIEQVVEVRLTD